MHPARLSSLAGTALLLGSLLLKACAPSPADPSHTDQLGKSLEAFASTGTGQPVDVLINTQVEPTLFVDGKAVRYVARNGQVEATTDRPAEWGSPRAFGDWNLQAITAFYPDACDGKAVRALALPQGQTLVEVSCSAKLVKEGIGDHTLEALSDISSEASLGTLLKEASLLGDLSKTRTVFLPGKGGINVARVASFTLDSTGVGPDGKPCTISFARSFEAHRERGGTVLGGLECSTSGDASRPTFDLSKIDAAQFADAMRMLSQAKGRSVEDSMGVTIKGDPQYGIVATATWQNPLQTARVAMQP